MFLLNRFLYRPILKIIEQRNKKIEDAIKAAEENLKEKAKIEEIKKQAVVEAEKEAVKVLEAAKKQAGFEGKQMIDEAREAADAEMEKKMQLLSGKLSEQEEAITKRVANLVVQTTKQVLKDSLSDKDQKAIIDKQIKKLAGVK